MKYFPTRIKHKIPGVVGIYQFLKGILSLPSFYGDYRKFKRAQKKITARFPVKTKDFFLCLFDKTTDTPFDPHYTYHPAWAARILAKENPKKHIDISSTVKFCTVVSAFIPVDFYDYRPAQLHLSGLQSKRGDLLALPFKDNSVESISCMHTIEHIGLGRYGEPIDPDGDIKAINELKRVLKPGGSLLFVVPVGRSRIEFNAHRIYSYEQITSYFSELELMDFSLIPDDWKNGIIKNASPEFVSSQRYGCGCFWFKK